MNQESTGMRIMDDFFWLTFEFLTLLAGWQKADLVWKTLLPLSHRFSFMWLVLEHQHTKENNTPALSGQEVNQERITPVGNIYGWGQCHGFLLVLWQCWLVNEKALWPVKSCARIPRVIFQNNWKIQMVVNWWTHITHVHMENDGRNWFS